MEEHFYHLKIGKVFLQVYSQRKIMIKLNSANINMHT